MGTIEEELGGDSGRPSTHQVTELPGFDSEDPDLPWVAHKVYKSQTSPDFVPYETVYVPCRNHSWVNAFIPHKLFRKGNKTWTNFRISLRKYQKVKGAWVRRQHYNLNNVEEAREVIKLIRAYFPELIGE